MWNPDPKYHVELLTKLLLAARRERRAQQELGHLIHSRILEAAEVDSDEVRELCALLNEQLRYL